MVLTAYGSLPRGREQCISYICDSASERAPFEGIYYCFDAVYIQLPLLHDLCDNNLKRIMYYVFVPWKTILALDSGEFHGLVMFFFWQATLGELQDKQIEFGVADIQLGLTTLEEVFLNIARQDRVGNCYS